MEFGGTCTCEGLGGCAFSSDGPWLEGRVYSGHGPSKFKLEPKQELDGVEPDAKDMKKRDAGSVHNNPVVES